MKKLLFKNANIVLTNSVIENGYLLVADGKIADFGAREIVAEDAEVIDLGGDWLTAGLIETHAHGGGGYDFMDGTAEAFEGIAKHHNEHGVTSMLATTLAGKTEETENSLKIFCETQSKIKCCNMLGVHLEGPYFSLEQKGSQDPRFIKDPDRRELDLFLSYGCVKRVSMAPELNGAMEAGRYLADQGVIVSAAHTNASFDEMEEASRNGFTLTTHLYSGMSGVHIANCKRHAGAIEAGLCLDALCAETICDGVHLPDGILRLIYKCKGRDNIILTSDASRGSGLPEGTVIKLGSLENGLDALILNGVANRPDMKAFAGSVASGDRLLRTELNAVGIPMWEVVGMATVNPARLLGIGDRKGRIAIGYDADLAVFTKDVYTRMTVVNGEITYGGK